MNALLSLAKAADMPAALVGGKAKALGQLIAFDAPVPPGFVVTPDADLDKLRDGILTTFDELGASHVAVRSSAAGEDSHGQSWAGQFESYLYVTRGDLLARITDCRASGRSDRAKSYDAKGGDMAVAVVVHAMVPSVVAGVMFTANPVTKNRNEIMIEAVYGLGEQLVQGLATPDNYLLAKPSGNIAGQNIASKTAMLVGSDRGITEQPVPAGRQVQPALSPDQCQELARLGIRLENAFGHPLDIEFAYDAGQLFIVQARPITTLTNEAT